MLIGAANYKLGTGTGNLGAGAAACGADGDTTGILG